MPRMRILNPIEQDAFDLPPVLNSIQRKQYFDFPQTLLQISSSLRTPMHRLGFLISCGYFKARKKFFHPRNFHPHDIKYVANQIGLSREFFDLSDYEDRTRQRHYRVILRFYGFRSFDQNFQEFIAREIQAMVRVQLKPRLIFWRCVDLLVREKVQVPNYFRLADLILDAINQHKKKLVTTVGKALSTKICALLDALFIQTPSLTGKSLDLKTAAYKLTLLKKLSQSTKPAKIEERMADLKLIKDLYQQLQPVPEALDLSHDGIRYYANSVIKSEIFQVARRTDEDRYLHVIAFIAHQYFRLQDNLVDVLLSSVQSYRNTVQREHKEQRYANRKQRNQLIKTLMGYLDENLLRILSEIQLITNDQSLGNAKKVEQISTLLQSQDTQKLDDLRTELAGELGEEDYFAILGSRSVRIQNRVSQIIKTMTFQGEANAKPLLAAIQYFKDKDGVITNNSPMDFLKADEHSAVIDHKQFRVSLYKVFLFFHVQNAIKSGTLNLAHSYKYRPLDDYLIDQERWQHEKWQLLERAGLQDIADPKKVLDKLDEVLFQQYQTTNKHILDGSNTLISFDKNSAFRLKTPKQDEVEAEPLQAFFPSQRYVSLLEVLATVNRSSNFLDEFQHWQQRYHHGRPAQKTFFAGIIGLGGGIGIRKMARISQHINETELDHTVNWFFSQEGIHTANDRVVQLMDRLELPNLCRQESGQLHTASDGQKFEVHVDSLNANHSFKYFGKYQGVSVYTFLDERNLFCHSTVISAAERESTYVIDGLMHNDVVKSDIHSTDTPGYTEAIFGATHLLGFSYAPRIKNLKRQKLYLFKSRRDVDCSKWKIKVAGYINTDLIEQHWDDILRLIVSIKLKEVTASDIFRRLNSYSKQHAVYRALKTFGKIIKSIFILRYIDEVELRQAIQRQLNKIEHAHRFTRAISVGDTKEFIQPEKQEQEIAEGCKQLIKNYIICRNYLYLSKKLEEIDDQVERDKLMEAIINGSVASWRHLNLLGEYDFSDDKLQDTVGIGP